MCIDYHSSFNVYDKEEVKLNDSKKKLIELIGKYVFGFLATLSLFYFMDRGGYEKYAIAAALSVLFLFLGRKKEWNIMTVLIGAIPVMVYILVGSMSGMIHGTYQISTIKNILYNLLPLLFSFSMFVFYGTESNWMVDWQFAACFLTYIMPNAWIMVLGYTWESTFAFSYGIFSIYYAYRKRWLLFGCSMLFMYLADKRIALLGVVIALLFMAVIWLFQNSKKVIFTIWTLVIGLIYGYLYLIYSGTLEAACWGLNVNTNGRVQMYTRMANQYDFLSGFLGNGIGIMENLLDHLQIDTYANLHNDLLKFYIELGFIGFLIYLISYYLIFHLTEKYFGKKEMCFLLGISIYSMLLFATDNVSIYLMYLIPFYSTIFAVLSSNRKNIVQQRRLFDDKENN